MDFEASIAELQSRLRQHREILETEESAKTTLVLPFLRALGFDVFNPAEVKAEFTCDVGTKKGEKVDYALCVNGEVTVLVECKPVSSELSIKHASQLFRYFAATNARFSLLTNGVIFKFFTDSDKANMMDEAPFFTFNLDDYRKADLRNLSAFQKSEFDVERIVAQAGTLKLQSQVMTELKKEFDNPSDEFVRVIASRLHDGMLTKPVRDKYQAAISVGIETMIRQRIDERLQNAMARNDDPAPLAEPEPVASADEIETTQVEIDGFNIIRAICAKFVSPDRIVMRDAKSYCAILLDDNNRKTVARMHFNSAKARYLGLFSGKDEDKKPVTGPIDIYQHADAIVARLQEFEAGK